MSTITSAFHTYGLLITEEAATRILQHVKETAPDLYRDFSEAEDVQHSKHIFVIGIMDTNMAL